MELKTTQSFLNQLYENICSYAQFVEEPKLIVIGRGDKQKVKAQQKYTADMEVYHICKLHAEDMIAQINLFNHMVKTIKGLAIPPTNEADKDMLKKVGVVF